MPVEPCNPSAMLSHFGTTIWNQNGPRKAIFGSNGTNSGGSNSQLLLASAERKAYETGRKLEVLDKKRG